MVQPNLRYRATSQNADEIRDVRDSFATSTLWGFTRRPGRATACSWT